VKRVSIIVNKQSPGAVFYNMGKLIIILTIYFLVCSCNSGEATNYQFSDTLEIRNSSAILYYPDSMQKELLKSELGVDEYKIAEDDYLYFMNNAVRYLDLKKVDKIPVTGPKILRFTTRDNSEVLIETNKFVDYWGIILFNNSHKPKQVDITIIDIEYNNLFR
jgi:hypothetical protein